jgi:hypothetical protein
VVKDTEPIKDDGLEPLQEASDSDASAAPYEAPNFDYEDDLTDFRDEFGYDPATGDMNDSAYEPYHAEDYGPDSEDGLTADSPVIEMGEDVVREDLKKNKGEKFRKAYKKDIKLSRDLREGIDNNPVKKELLEAFIQIINLDGINSLGQLRSYANPDIYYNERGGGAYSLEDLYHIDQAAKASGVPREVIAALGLIETKNVHTMSQVGAGGIFQHMEKTARGSGEVVGYRLGEVEVDEEGNYVIDRDGTKVTIGRCGDYRDKKDGDIYYPFEDGRYGVESFFGTANVLDGKFKSKTWFTAIAKYNGAPGSKFNAASRNGLSILTYVAIGPYPGQAVKEALEGAKDYAVDKAKDLWAWSPWGEEREKESKSEKPDRSREEVLQEASKESRKYILKFAFAIEGAASIDWSVLDDYQPKYKEVEVPTEEGAEPISLYDLNKAGYGVEELYRNNWNREYQFLRVPFPSDADINIPDGSKYFEQPNVITSQFKISTDADAGYGQQVKDSGKIRSSKDSGVIKAGAFNRPTDDSVYAYYGKETDKDGKERLVIPHVTRYARGDENPPTLQDLVNCGIDPIEFIEANRHYFGGTDRSGRYHPPHPEWERHMKNTYLRPGSVYQIDSEKAVVFEGLLKSLAYGEEVSDIGDLNITTEERSHLRYVDDNLEDFCVDRMFEATHTGEGMGVTLSWIESEYGRYDKPWHADYAQHKRATGVTMSDNPILISMGEEDRGIVGEYDGLGQGVQSSRSPFENPIIELLRRTKDIARGSSMMHEEVNFYDLISEEPVLMLQWLDEFFYPHTLRVLDHRRSMTMREIKFFLTTVELYAQIAENNAIIFPESFWDQYEVLKKAYFEVKHYESEKHEKYKIEPETPLDSYNNDIELDIRTKEEWLEIMDLFDTNELTEEKVDRLEEQRGAQEAEQLREAQISAAEEKISQELEKFEIYGLYAGAGEFVENEWGGHIRVDIYVEGSDAWPLAYTEFHELDYLDKFTLRSFPKEGPFGRYPIKREDYNKKGDEKDKPYRNKNIDRISFGNLKDSFFHYLEFMLVQGKLDPRGVLSSHPGKMASIGKDDQYVIFTTDKFSKGYYFAINPRDEMNYNTNHYTGSIKVRERNAKGEIDGNIYTLSTYEWEYSEKEGTVMPARYQEGENKGKFKPSIELGRYKTIQEVERAIDRVELNPRMALPSPTTDIGE